MRSWIFGNKGEGQDQVSQGPSSSGPLSPSGNQDTHTSSAVGSTGPAQDRSGVGFPGPERHYGSDRDGGRRDQSARNVPSSGENTKTPGVRQQQFGGALQAFMAGRAPGSGTADAEMERRVSVAARNLGDGVQKIVMAAKMGGGQNRGPGGSGNPNEWKIRLLQLLGGSDDEVDSDEGDRNPLASDLDVLLTNATCDKFVLRCVESELPPNLIHCLRLLRVLELQHAHAVAAQQRDGEIGVNSGPVSTVATSKVAKLLCLLCTDPSVGEQLRPHLFGLLALSGASYPASGVHVASAASSVILAFSESCLSTSLVWFLHDRKMIVHMTDDIKELCGMTAVSSSSSVSRCLYGKAAEAAGLWVVALRTVVHLVTQSCNHNCLELLKDYDSAGGYHVLAYAIANSGSGHVPKLLELVTALVCCNTANDTKETSERSLSTLDANGLGAEGQAKFDGSASAGDTAESTVATNPDAFEIIDDLVLRSVPLLIDYVESHSGQRPELSSMESLHDLAAFSANIARSLRSSSSSETGDGVKDDKVDLASELLVTTLQLYSDHGKNYEIIEPNYNVLSYYLLAFPTFPDVSTKVLVLKTLEYVCTGLAVSNSVKPLSVASEIFFALCKSLLQGPPTTETQNGDDERNGGEVAIFESLLQDSEMLCGTLVKLLEFDETVSQVMIEGGLLGKKLDEFLELVLACSRRRSSQSSETSEEIGVDNAFFPVPPASHKMDGAYSAVCRILKLVVCHPSSRMARGEGASISQLLRKEKQTGISTEKLHGNNLNLLLTTGIMELGTDASASAMAVFETMMSKCHDDMLKDDMACLVEVLDYFSELTGRIVGVSFVEMSPAPASKRKRPPAIDGSMQTTPPLESPDIQALTRQAELFNVFRVVLEANELSQDVFRVCGGFESIVRVFLCLECVSNSNAIEDFTASATDSVGSSDDVPRGGKHKESHVSTAIMKLLESTFALLAAATTPTSRNQKHLKNQVTDLSTSSLAMDILTEDDSSALSGPTSTSSPAFTNRAYLRQRGFYVDFAGALAGTGILSSSRHARSTLNLSLAFMDPAMSLATSPDDESHRRNANDATKSQSKDTTRIRNPDAARLILGVAIRLPQTPSDIALAKRAIDELLRLCSMDMAGSALSQIASSGLCRSLTNPHEFAFMLEDRNHPLYSRFVLLLRRIGAFSMTYMDFVALLRCVAGPILRSDGDDLVTADTGGTTGPKFKRIRLPVITSSVQTKTAQQKSSSAQKSESWKARETDFCNRLETLSVIAERGDRVARCEMGGDSLNTIALYMQKVPLEERLFTLAEQGRLKFLEIESVDASTKANAASMAMASSGAQSSASSASAAEKVWAPLSSTGFTYCMWLRLPTSIGENSSGNIFALDLSSSPFEKTGSPSFGGGASEFLSMWYDVQNQRFCVLSSSSSRNEPTCFPVSPLLSGVWHHILLTYQTPKRSMLGRKAVLCLFVDGRPLEAEVKVEVVNLPPTARMYIGAPNPVLASSGNVRGALPMWELGPTLLLSTVLGLRDATAMFTAGPDFQGMFWGDRPQRLSLTASATAAFAMLAESGEKGSVAGALRRRGVPEMEAAGHVMRERGFGGGPVAGPESDSLTAVGLLCKVSPEYVICGFRAAASSSSMRDGSSSSNKRHYSRRLVNVARINSSNESVSTDAVLYGNASIISPRCFAENIQWIGGPNVLMPVVNAAQSAPILALALRLIRESVHRHPPNLEMLQAGGGYRMLGLLLRQKRIMDASVLDQCFAFAVHGFVPGSSNEEQSAATGETNRSNNSWLPPTWAYSDRWVFADLDAMKYLLLNHQVWDLSGSKPELPLRLLSFLNGLVAAHSAHAAFNSRRLHLLGIIRWTLHLMLEATELFSAGASAVAAEGTSKGGEAAVLGSDIRLDETRGVQRTGGMSSAMPSLNVTPTVTGATALKNGWYVKPPSVSTTAVGGDPGNALLLGCKTLLRRVLTYMLTPGDLEAIAGAAIYTVSITGSNAQDAASDPQQQQADQSEVVSDHEDETLPPGPVARVYLLRLLEELVVDGVNEIVTSSNDKGAADGESPSGSTIQPHAGGGTSSNQSYLATSMLVRRRNDRNQLGPASDAMQHPKHQQAQAFLSAFAGILTPVWFACILEGCRDEASASAVLRLMILMLQSSPTFAAAFEEAGGFAPLVLSIPKFSTCPSITMSMLSQLLHAPILHLPCFATLDASQLCEVFDSESDATELIMNENAQGGLHTPSDPSCGIFALLAECLGRNIQLASFPNEVGKKARQTNEAVLHLLSHRHTFSSAFQEFCRTPDFLEPLAQALCLVHDEKLQQMQKKVSSQDISKMADASRPAAGREQLMDSRRRMSGRLDSDGEEDFISWPSGANSGSGDDGSMKMKRRGSLSDILTDETPTERFVGKAEEDAETSGIGMVQLLHLVLSHAVLKGPLAAPLVSALFRSFPIHASPDQVEAFHLVLIEHCRSVVEDALQRGEPIALANCVGVSSVLLDRLMAGFFTSEPVLEAVKIVLSTLGCLTATGTYASRTLGTTDQNMLIADTAHLARLTCLTALQRSRPMGPYDEGDDDLKLAVLDKVGQNLRQLLTIPSNVGFGGGQGKRQSAGGYPAPAPGSRFYPLWQSASLARCCPPSVSCTYPDLAAVEEPDRAFVVALMAEIHIMLLDKRRDIREQAVVIVVSLLQYRRGFMSELLITDIPRGDNRTETVDLMNRGGFGALLVAHEAASITENISTVPRGRSSRDGGSASVGKKYGTFFEWLEKNQAQVAAVFHGIHIQASRLLPGVDAGATTPEEAIENEQKVMLLKLTSQDSSDRTILGGLERAELAQRSHDKTAESHALWKRQGFDDLSSGAMQWKFLLRQLKGSCSIWEGGIYFEEESPFSKAVLLSSFLRKRKLSTDGNADIAEEPIEPTSSAKKKKLAAVETVTRWKLDLTEGYERQRRRLLPNYEFHTLYNIDETVDTGDHGELVRAPSAPDLVDLGDQSNADEGSPSIGDSTKPTTEILDSDGLQQLDATPSSTPDAEEHSGGRAQRRSNVIMANSMEATAALLKEMNLGKIHEDDDDDDLGLEDEEDDDDIQTSADSESRLRSDSVLEDSQLDSANMEGAGRSSESDTMNASKEQAVNTEGPTETAEVSPDMLASSYDLITGLLQAGDWPEKSYNVRRCTGLEVRKALLLWCRGAIYIVDGFEQTDGEGLEGKINRLEKSTSTYYVNLRPHGFKDTAGDTVTQEGQMSTPADSKEAEKNRNKEEKPEQDSSDKITYHHRSQRIAFSDLYSVYRRRYQLQQNALEFYDVHRNGTLIAFSNHAEREEILSKVLASPLPNSIYSSSILGGSTSINYKKFMTNLRSKITSQWVQGKMTNFDFIMHMNSFAGRSYNDLTQYPVFPWILADYESEEIDLNDPNAYRDLSKPMGAQGEERAIQFKERYEALEANYFNEDEPPPFHYGTHYSCAAYVLYYLMRLEPFSRLALSLQGGSFDVADRLFHNIGASWRSASKENLQDVRELIPEFFYLPEFLVNSNMFDFGTTQSGKTVHDVTLPPWARGDPRRFIRIHRQALESNYVSKHLHQWVDLVFGYKQRGREAVAALNTFVHVTYEGQVDLDTITDPIQRESTIAQIQNFGQTPSRLERKPFPQRNVVVAAKEKGIDFNALSSLAALTPPFCIVGAPHRVYLRVTNWDTCRVGMSGQADSSVGDMCLVKGQLVGVGRTCALILPSKKYYRYGGPNNGVSVHVAITSARYREVNRILSIHDGMHRAPISVAKPSLNGLWLVTGCMDSTVRVWKYDGSNMQLRATLCGHEGGKVTCIDVSTTFGTIVTGGADGNVLLWDLRTLTFLRQLRHEAPTSTEDAPAAVSVSINHKNGNVVTLVGCSLCVFDINGTLLAKQRAEDSFPAHSRPSCAISADCPEWMEDGVVGITGHMNGDVRLWSLDHNEHVLRMRHLVPDKVHSCPITALRVSGDKQDTLLVGDKSGKMSVCTTLKLEQLNQQELSVIVKEIQSGASYGDLKVAEKSKTNTAEGDKGWIGGLIDNKL